MCRSRAGRAKRALRDRTVRVRCGGDRHVRRHNAGVVPRQPDSAPERGFIVAALAQGVDSDDELAELRELAQTALVEPIAELVQHRARPERRTYLGKGKLEELKHAYKAAGAEVLLVDDELEPAQQRTLEDALQSGVVDRTQLILDIFAQHATSAEGKLQVELAQLEYNLPRMRGLWQHLERLGGGIGTRGPGESQLETDRRLARRRIALLRRKLRELERRRAVQRQEPRESTTPVDAVLEEIGATAIPVELVLNKADLLDPLRRRRLANRFPGALELSARTGEGLEELRARVAERFAERFRAVRLLVPYEDGR